MRLEHRSIEHVSGGDQYADGDGGDGDGSDGSGESELVPVGGGGGSAATYRGDGDGGRQRAGIIEGSGESWLNRRHVLLIEALT